MPPKKKAPAVDGEPSDATGDLGGLDRYIRRWYRSIPFPNVDNDGMVYVKKQHGLVGTAAKKDHTILKGKQLAERMNGKNLIGQKRVH